MSSGPGLVTLLVRGDSRLVELERWEGGGCSGLEAAGGGGVGVFLRGGGCLVSGGPGWKGARANRRGRLWSLGVDRYWILRQSWGASTNIKILSKNEFF